MKFSIIADFLGWMTLTLGYVVVWTISLKYPKARRVLLTAFLLRAIFALIHYYIVPLPDSQADAIAFERFAAEWAQGGIGNILAHFTSGAFLYSSFLALFYTLFGRSPLMAQGLNVLFGTLIVLNIYLISLSIWGERVAKRSASLAAIFPTLVLYSAITLREVAVVYPFTLGALYLIRYSKSDNLKDAILAFIFFAISMGFHTGMIAGIAVEILLIFGKYLQVFLVSKRHILIKRIVGFLIIIICVLVLLNSKWGLEKVGGIEREESVIDWLAYQQGIAARDRAAYLEGVQPRNLLDLLWQVPVRILYFLYTPFPWMVRSAVDLLGLVMAVLNFSLTLLFINSLPAIWRESSSRNLAYIIIGLIIVFALTTSNYGTSIRHSSKIVPLVLAVIRIPKIKV